MKKLIAFVIAAMMVLSMIPVMAFTAFADDEIKLPDPDDGDWSTYRTPGDYKEGAVYKPAPGFEYTSEGFKTTAEKDLYKNTSPWFTVQTSAPQDISQGFYMQVRVDEFSYDGTLANGEPTGNTPQDEWISFSISDRPLVAQGSMEHSNNWFSLIRGSGNGKATVHSQITTMNTDAGAGSSPYLGGTPIDVPVNSDGQEVVELEIINNNGTYDIKVCGVTVSGMDKVSPHIAAFENCYIGITFHSGVLDGVANCTILKQGTSKADAETPTGSTSKTSEENNFWYGDMIASDTVPAGEPCLLFDGTRSSYKNDPACSSCVLSMTADNTWKLSATDTLPYFVWSIKNELTYEATDFPVFGVMLKNFNGDSLGAYFCAGQTISATDAAKLEADIWSDDTNKTYAKGGDTYTFITLDLSESELWNGRIHNIRPHFGVSDPADPYFSEFDINFMGFFRNVEEAFTYADKQADGYTITETEAPAETTAPTGDDETTAAEGETTVAGGETTVAGDETTAATAGGCASVIGFSSAAILVVAAAAVALKKKD